MPQINLAIAGLGFMGVTHLKAIANSPYVRVAAVVSSDDRKLAGDFSGVGGNLDTTADAIDLSGVKKYRRIEEAFADREIDAIDLCLPTHLHAAAAIAAMRSGKHVLVEKPMALDEAECRQMIDAAARTGRTLMCAQVLRFFPMYSVLQPGQLLSGRFRRRCAAPSWGGWLREKSQSGGGVFDLLIHDVDVMLHLYGEPLSVTASGYEDLPNGIDLIDAQFAYDGFSIDVSGGWHPGDYPFSMEYTIVASNGTWEYRFADGDPIFYGVGAQPMPLTAEPGFDGYRAQIEYFAQCAAAGAPPAACPPEESARAVYWTRRMEEARRA
jgi:predicted dehydrogenase